MVEGYQEKRDYSGLIAAICFFIIIAALASFEFKQLISELSNLSVIFN